MLNKKENTFLFLMNQKNKNLKNYKISKEKFKKKLKFNQKKLKWLQYLFKNQNNIYHLKNLIEINLTLINSLINYKFYKINERNEKNLIFLIKIIKNLNSNLIINKNFLQIFKVCF